MKFVEVTRRRSVRGECPVCKRRTVRSVTVTHTVNPFNRNKDGAIKTHDEVLTDVVRELDRMKPNFAHKDCAGRPDVEIERQP